MNKHLRDPNVLYPYLKAHIQAVESITYHWMKSSFWMNLRQYLTVLFAYVYVTGNNARFLSKDVITEFRGRGDKVHMYPLSFATFMSVYLALKKTVGGNT